MKEENGRYCRHYSWAEQQEARPLVSQRLVCKTIDPEHGDEERQLGDRWDPKWHGYVARTVDSSAASASSAVSTDSAVVTAKSRSAQAGATDSTATGDDGDSGGRLTKMEPLESESKLKTAENQDGVEYGREPRPTALGCQQDCHMGQRDRTQKNHHRMGEEHPEPPKPQRRDQRGTIQRKDVTMGA
jgi:hypothetical protein